MWAFDDVKKWFGIALGGAITLFDINSKYGRKITGQKFPR